jgi:beta-N-acetylhexosaminidase
MSRRRFFAMAGLGALALACGGGGNATAPSPTSPPATRTAPARPSPTPRPPAPTTTPPPGDSVSLEAMIGQMIMAGFRGYTLEKDSPTYEGIRSQHLGNVVLFDHDIPSGATGRNIESPRQLAALGRALQDLAPHPLLIATDQEGGFVARLNPDHGFPPTLSAQALGNLRDLRATRERSRMMATTLVNAGVNLNLAPVVDVNVNPNNPVIGSVQRSFSSDPEEVARQALAFIEGHHEAGVLCTLKHFPGHGSSLNDSHLGFVDVTSTWSERELIPFRRVIDAGLADVVMTAHIFNANLDPTNPATLSKATITGLLREQLGYGGVVITDDMQMGAISNFYRFEEAVVVAVEAGADIVAISNNGAVYESSAGERAFTAILDAVRGRRLSEQRIQQSFDRITALKNKLA